MPTAPEPKPDALMHAHAIEHWARADAGLRGQELRAAAAELRRLHALTTRAPDAEAESVWLFKATDGKWMHFVSEKHRLGTMADGRWEVRQFFAAPPAPEALEVKRG